MQYKVRICKNLVVITDKAGYELKMSDLKPWPKIALLLKYILSSPLIKKPVGRGINGKFRTVTGLALPIIVSLVPELEIP